MGPIKKRIIVVAGAALVAATPSLMGFLGKWEGQAVYVVYADKLAGGLPTVCKGLTRHVTTTPIVVNERWTPEKCDAEEQAAVFKVQSSIRNCITTTVSQNTFDALSSFAWNVGASAACGSVAVRQINGGDLEAGCRSIAYTPAGLPNWSSAGGKFYQGLHNRRIDEMKLCIKP